MEELSLHLLDIAENSIRAGATKLEIVVRDSPKENLLYMKIMDNGRGMKSEVVSRLLDPFYTTRTERNIGLGIPLLKMTADSCNGSLLISSELGKGTTIEVAMEHNNIDRPPLGNITATIVTLLVGWPLINLYYQHAYLPKELDLPKENLRNMNQDLPSENSFTFDTEEIKKRLDDLPINSNRVIQFLRQYLQENLSKLYGGENNEIFG